MVQMWLLKSKNISYKEIGLTCYGFIKSKLKFKIGELGDLLAKMLQH